LRQAVATASWDAIICDYRLPGFNALEALAVCRSAGVDVPFVIVSGAIGEETAVAAMKAGAHDYVMKDKLSRLVPAVEREMKDAHVRRERRQALDRLRVLLQEKELLLKEVHHRVKNNLQIVSSLLNIQAGTVQDSASLEIMRECRNRIRSMAIIHETLCQTGRTSSINLEAYLTRLTRELLEAYGVPPDALRLRTDIEDVQLPLDIALPCGLIITELVSNALKHAFPTLAIQPPTRSSSSSGQTSALPEIDIRFGAGADDHAYLLEVSDNGVGLPPTFEVTQPRSLGLSLVNSLATQIGGGVETTQGTAPPSACASPAPRWRTRPMPHRHNHSTMKLPNTET